MHAKESLVDPEEIPYLFSPRESEQVQTRAEKSQVRLWKRRMLSVRDGK